MTPAPGFAARLTATRDGRRTVLGNTALQIAGYSAGLLLTGATAALYARYLGAGSYGTFSVIVVVFTLGGSIVNGSLDTWAVRAFASEQRVEPLLFRSLLGVKAAATTALVGAVLAGSLLLPVAEPTRLAVLAFGVATLVTSLQGAVFAALQARGRFGLVVGADLATRALTLAGAVALYVAPAPHSASARVGLLGALAATSAVAVLSLTLARGRRLRLPLGVAYDRTVWRRLLREPPALAALSLLGLLNYRVDVLVLAALRPGRDVSPYALATRVIEVALPLATAYVTASFPVLSRSAAVRPEQLALQVRRAVELLALGSAALAVPLALGAPYVVRTIAGAAYGGAVLPLRILALSLPFSFVSTYLLFALIAGHAQRRALWLVAASFALNLGLNAALIPILGTTGPALATLATEAAAAACLIAIVRRVLAAPVLSRPLLQPIAAAAGAALAGAGALAAAGPAAAICTAAVLYAAAVAAFRLGPAGLRPRLGGGAS